MLPPAIHSDVKSNAERKLFQRIRDASNTSDWVCIHGLGLAHHPEKRRGEIDFALITPQALLVLEVKGGRVRRQEGRWLHTDRYGTATTKHESPFQQAYDAMFALKRDLRVNFGVGSRLANALLGIGVLFPDVAYESLGVEVDRAQVYDKKDWGRPFERWVAELVAYTRGIQPRPRNGLNKKEIEQLVDFLRGDFELIPSFDVVAQDTNRGLARLTRAQAKCLADAADEPRLVVEGSAGTGKSMIALESAKREASAGNRTLLLCFNQLLAAKLREEVGSADARLSVQHAHGFMRKTIEKSPFADEFARRAMGADKRQLYNVVYPEFASLALAEAPQRFDSLVVDEAQDLLAPAFVDVLDQSVQGGVAAGRWRLFMDVNEQASVYGRMDADVLAKLRALSARSFLPINCRNTTQIGIATRVIARPKSAALAQHEGEAVERRWYDDPRSLGKQVRAVLQELVERSVPRSSITVLYPRMIEELENVFASERVRPLSVETVGTLGSATGEWVTHASASAFKGLENDVIVVAGVEKLDNEWWRAVTYVGLSRARVKLYVILHSELRETVDKGFERMIRETMEEGIS